MDVTAGFVDAVVTSPLGVTLLASLESRTRRDDRRGLALLATTPSSVAAAVEDVGRMSFGDLMDLVLRTAVLRAGPWMSDAPATVAAAYRDVAARLPIAEAIDDRFGSLLHEPVSRAAQQWWTDDDSSTTASDRLAPLFRDFDHVYGAGQFTWAGLWTVTDPPPEVHHELIGAWELERGPVTRCSLPAEPTARVFEIHRPADWVRLVIEHPRAGASHPEWELPGINQRTSDLSPLLTVSGQRAARTSIRHHLVPDWRTVADHYDGVHLSWAGFITAEGCVTDLEHGDVAMMRYWFSERTHWLADVFTEPESAADPLLRDPVTDTVRTTSTVSSSSGRRSADVESLRRLLGR